MACIEEGESRARSRYLGFRGVAFDCEHLRAVNLRFDLSLSWPGISLRSGRRGRPESWISRSIERMALSAMPMNSTPTPTPGMEERTSPRASASKPERARQKTQVQHGAFGVFPAGIAEHSGRADVRDARDDAFFGCLCTGRRCPGCYGYAAPCVRCSTLWSPWRRSFVHHSFWNQYEALTFGGFGGDPLFSAVRAE
jgi:hypothetical protein